MADKKKMVSLPKNLNMATQLQVAQGVVAPQTEKTPAISSEKPEEKAPVSIPSGNQWKDFLEYAQEYKDSDNESIQIWLDATVKNTLDEIRKAGVKIPVKHLLSAAVRVFIESNAEEVRALMEKKPKTLI